MIYRHFNAFKVILFAIPFLFILIFTFIFFVNQSAIQCHEFNGCYGDGCCDKNPLETSRDYVVNKIVNNADNDLPNLFIEIKHKRFVELSSLRKIALKNKMITREQKIWFPAKISNGYDQPLKVKLRLKGEFIDHLRYKNKWSLRIKLKDKKTFNGLRVFSINQPMARNFLGEFFLSELMRHNDVLSPRMAFYNVFMNGESMGIMQMEEFFTKEMIESQERKESVLLKSNEDALWQCSFAMQRIYQMPGFDNVQNRCASLLKNIEINAFNLRNQQLANYQNGVSLLRSFFEGSMKASEVFDMDNVARYFALIHISGEYHGSVWHNIRYYYNPMNAKIEVVSYDNNATIYWDNQKEYEENGYELYAALKADKEFYAKFIDAVDEITTDIIEGNKYAALHEKVNNYYYPILKSEFYYLKPLDIHQFKQRARIVRDYYLSDKHQKKRANKMLETKTYASQEVQLEAEAMMFRMINRLFLAYDISNAFTQRLEIKNIFPNDLTIVNIYAKEKGRQRKEDVKTSKNLPFLIGKKTVILDYKKPEFSEYDLFIEAKIAGENRVYKRKVVHHYASKMTRGLIAESTIPLQLKIHPYLTYQKGQFVVKPGSWVVKEHINIPQNTRLIIGKNTSLFFKEECGIISRSPIIISGSKANPIILTGEKNKYWRGIAVIESKAKSTLKNTSITNVTNMQYNQWSLSGAVTFYKSDVEIDGLAITHIASEDALNIVHSNFNITDLIISNSNSDAFDSDFSNGTIANSRFRNIGHLEGGGDAIDLSGSHVEIRDVHFDRVNDKAVSVGEKSDVQVDNAKIDNVAIGAVAKDNSRLLITNSHFSNVQHYALMAYQKKPAYPLPSKIIANHNYFDTAHQVIAQFGNVITINGQESKPQTLDVDNLYHTQIKKSAP